jgi:fructose-bisphosphate aldolase, class I
MQIPIATPTERVRHVVQSAFNGRRIVIFSGGATHSDDALLQEVQAIHSGGGFGSKVEVAPVRSRNSAATCI